MSGRSSRLIVYLVITLFAMTRTISQMFEGVRPFDWLMLVIETLVLLLILYEVIVGIRRHRREEKRAKELAHIIAALSEIMNKGKELQLSVPDPATTDWPVHDSWMKSVKAWSSDTNTFLATHSSRASSAFLLLLDTASVTSMVIRPNDSSFQLHGYLREYYQRLVVQLSNLRQIMEKPEVYF